MNLSKFGFKRSKIIVITVDVVSGQMLCKLGISMLQYCLLESDPSKGSSFRLPTLEEIQNHRVVVATLGTASYLLQAGVSKGKSSSSSSKLDRWPKNPKKKIPQKKIFFFFLPFLTSKTEMLAKSNEKKNDLYHRQVTLHTSSSTKRRRAPSAMCCCPCRWQIATPE